MPRAELAGVVFLPRTIDKVRATLPGGNAGEYNIPGFSAMLLERLGIPLDDFVAAVAKVSTDDEVAAFVLACTTADEIAGWNSWIRERQPRGGDRNAAYESYPWLRERPISFWRSTCSPRTTACSSPHADLSNAYP